MPPSQSIKQLYLPFAFHGIDYFQLIVLESGSPIDGIIWRLSGLTLFGGWKQVESRNI